MLLNVPCSKGMQSPPGVGRPQLMEGAAYQAELPVCRPKPQPGTQLSSFERACLGTNILPAGTGIAPITMGPGGMG